MSSRRGQTSRKRPLHLPIIAPKDEGIPSTNPSSNNSIPTPVRAAIIQSRMRFPPRSRTGCWTCRSRKIKCDEIHPQCNQCARLGHVCDYQPRLCFRDDTRRVRERMPDVKTVGNSVWDPNQPFPSPTMSPGLTPSDLLPAFAQLTSDEDRERKAEASVPGTYHVVAVPESFSHLPEYADDALDTVSNHQASSPTSDGGEHEPTGNVFPSNDPNVIILNRFRDARKPVFSNRRLSAHSPDSDLAPSSMSGTSIYTALQEITEEQIHENVVELRNYEMALLDHFQNYVWMQVTPGGDGYLGANIFEQEASNFPPLLHAILALSALSLIRQGGSQNMDALHYYHQAVPSLQSSLDNNEDLLSNGLYLTHFLLLIYEIAFSKPNHRSNLWSHHLSRLLHLRLLRRSVSRHDQFPFIVWGASHIDLSALLSGAGTGEYVKAVLENHLLPEPESLLFPTGSDSTNMIFPNEYDTLQLALRVYRELFLLTVRLGLLAAELRRARSSSLHSHSNQLHRELENMRPAFQQLWDSPETRFLVQNRASLTKRSQEYLQQISILFHTSVLFSHMSLRWGQSIDSAMSLEKEIHHHAESILQIAEAMIAQGQQNGPLFITFPIFLAGALPLSTGLKMMALELLSSLGDTEMGYDSASTYSMLQIVCEAQMRQEVNWMEVLASHGLQLVNYG